MFIVEWLPVGSLNVFLMDPVCINKTDFAGHRVSVAIPSGIIFATSRKAPSQTMPLSKVP